MNENDIKLEELTKALTDEGKLIEAGWVGYRFMCVPNTAGATQVDETRKAFFAGAQHLFSSIMAALDPESDPTEADVKRMDLIHKELERFAEALAAQVGKICRRCKRSKFLHEFANNSRESDGKHRICRDCRRVSP